MQDDRGSGGVPSTVTTVSSTATEREGGGAAETAMRRCSRDGAAGGALQRVSLQRVSEQARGDRSPAALRQAQGAEGAPSAEPTAFSVAARWVETNEAA